MLGLRNKGHLGEGADGDVTIYQPDDDTQRMFELPRYVIHRGVVVVDDGEIRNPQDGSVYHVAPEFDDACLPDIQKWFEDHYTIRFRNYPVSSLQSNDLTELDTTDRAQKIQQDFVKGLGELVTQYESAGERAKAMDLLKSMLKLDPNLDAAKTKLKELEEAVFDERIIEIEIDASGSWVSAGVVVSKGEPFRVESTGTYKLMVNETL
ncbi:Protein FwdA, partial [Durusdinium trenchii]